MKVSKNDNNKDAFKQFDKKMKNVECLTFFYSNHPKHLAEKNQHSAQAFGCVKVMCSLDSS